MSYILLYVLGIVCIIPLNIRNKRINDLHSNYDRYSIEFREVRLWFIFLIVITLIIGLRYKVGGDYEDYVQIYNLIHKGKEIYKTEPFFYLINKISIYINFGPWFVFTVFALLTNFLILTTIIKESKSPLISLIIFFGCGFFFAQMNLMRQALAIAFVFYACNNIWKNNFILYVFFCFLASTFHLTALFMIPFYFLAKIKWNRYLLFIVALISFISFMYLPFSYLIFEMISKISPPQYQSIIELVTTKPSGVNTGLNIIFQFLLICIFITYYNSITVISKKYLCVTNLYIYGILIETALANLWVLPRLSYYLTVFQLIAIPGFIYFCVNKNSKYFVYILLILLFSIIFLKNIYTNSHDTMPYQFIFMKD